ncbi:MAG: NAD(+)/NADH kinase [Candidatus Obscuribacter sp.]|jgi:diacylglycerol kinase family enzyme|nr:NAD(+)/NADH kinase [Candidatus Obscuribacter sp.]MBK7838710.1 NAD(+)/NADH kinase [Candidatus Obscuribacter sp.]MBK9621244.1 NAD(+)/NADH kinase [Candidatus Obscuribacter sp.]MBL0185254.1 NAD(+)/NADH kinase [Candidatus Obscuribacter sp.]
MKNALLVYNPTSGSASGPELWLGALVHKLSTTGGYNVLVSSTTRQTTADNILHSVYQVESTSDGDSASLINKVENLDLIVAAGGDGTVRMLLHAVASHNLQIPIGIVPMGTGNLLARNLKIYEDNILIDQLDRSINIILKGKPQSIDLGIMNGQYFAAAAGVGPLSDAIIAPDRRDKETWKMLAYASSMMQTLTESPVLFDITADGESFRVPATGIFITNIADLGVGTLSDTASMHDGLLDLCILSPREFGDYVNYGFHFATPINAMTGGKAPYYVRKVKSVKIQAVKRIKPLGLLEAGISKIKSALGGKKQSPVTSDKLKAMIDGDAWGTTPIDIKIAPSAVRVLIAQEQEAL